MLAKLSRYVTLKEIILAVVLVSLCFPLIGFMQISYVIFKPVVRNYFRRIPFDSAVWRDEKRVYSDDPVRNSMLPSLLRKHALIGKSMPEVQALLGQPMDRAEYTYYAERLERSVPPDALVYWIAPQEGFMAFDSIWLILTPDSTGTINNYWITHAGVKEVRNPDCERFEVFRIDEPSRRFFVPGASDDLESFPRATAVLRQIHAYATKCHPAWGEDWSASFFTDRKLAGYKDDRDIAPFLRDGSWAEGYVADFDDGLAQLTLHPALSKNRQVFSINLH
jgi:hypothetical protein